MNYISITYCLVWRFKTHKHIQLTKDKRMCFDVKRGFKKKMYKGVWLDSKTYVSKSNFDLELIPKYEYMEDNFLNDFSLNKNI